MAGISTIGYTYLDHFGGEWVSGLGTGPFTYEKKDKVTADNITTFQVKGGGVFNLDDRMSAFANLGYVEKPPILDNVIDYDGNVHPILTTRNLRVSKLVVSIVVV